MADSVAPLTPHKKPKYPIVFCHGISGFDRLLLIPSFVPSSKSFGLEYWFGVKSAFEEKGITVYFARVPPYGTIEERATALNQFINKKMATESKKKKDSPNSEVLKQKENFVERGKVNLVAHSMGGLDSRYLISKVPAENKKYDVASLTTISTPHHGSEIADLVTEKAQVIGIDVPKCITQLTTQAMKQFNENVKNDPTVSYFSYGARYVPEWSSLYGYTWGVISKRNGGSNDGLVSVNSARWGKYLGTIEDVDHLDLINWINPMKRAFNGLKFNAVEFYLKVAYDLAENGF